MKLFFKNIPVFLAVFLSFFSLNLLCQKDKPAAKTETKESTTVTDDKDVLVWSSEDLYIQAEAVFSPEPGVTVATGYVEIYHLDQHIQADKVTYQREEGFIIAEGNVTFQSEDTTISCEKMEGKTDGTGVFYNALIYAGQQIIRAEVLKREKDKTYFFESAEITPCTQINPCWSLQVGSGKLVTGDYVFLSNIFIKIKSIPVFYIPFFYLPLDNETGRTAGFLFPTFGSSNLYGTTLTEAFFLPITRSIDTTLYATYYSEKGLGFGLEGRYIFDEYSGGSFNAFYLDEADTGNKRYNIIANHRQNIFGWKLTANTRITSDISYNQDYTDDIDYIASRSSSYINANLSKKVGPFSLSLQTNYNESVVSGKTTTVKAELPTAEIRLNSLKLFGSPVYITFDTNYSNLQKKTILNDLRYERLDFYAEVGAVLSGLPWLKISPKAAYRFTNYSESLDPDTGELLDEPVGREYSQFNIKLTGPIFYKVYFTPGFGYADKFKHIIEPSVSYNYTSTPKNAERLIYYDGVDYVLPVNEMKVNIAHRLIANQKVGENNYKPREILTWQLSQYISLDTELKTSYGSQYDRFSTDVVSTLSPLVSTLQFRPSEALSLTNRLEYDYTGRALSSVSFDLSWKTQDIISNIQWRKTIPVDTGRVASDQVTANGKFRLFDRTFDLFYKLSYDIEQDRLWQGSVSLRYNHQCFSLIGSYDYYDIGLRQEGKFSFNVELTGISGILPDMMKGQ